jgi:hypothetical protein
MAGNDGPRNSKNRKRTRLRRFAKADECVIPPKIPKSVIHKYLFKRDAAEERTMTAYVEAQTRKERVQHLEKIGSERVMGRLHDLGMFTPKGTAIG